MDNRAAPEIPGIRQPANVTQDIRLLVCKLLNSPKPAKTFPGSQPISFHHSDIEEKLLQQDYYVCEKTDGLRGLMLIVINPVTKEQGCFIIDRENNYYQVNGFRFPRLPKQSRKELLETFQDGTLIDGELVLQTNPVTKVKELRYLMFDCLAINGRCIVQSPTSSRLAHLGKEFFKPYYDLRSLYPAQCANFPFKISMKHMSFSVDLVKVANSLDKLPHVSDGLIFTPVTTPYVVGGKDSLLLKWKPETENTVDFKMILDIPKAEDTSLSKNDPNRFFYNYGVKPSFHLYIWQGGADVNARLHDFEQPFSKKELEVLDRTYKKFADLDVSDSQWAELKSLGEPLNGRIVECAKDQETGVWRMLRFRDDKLNGNYVSVVQKVLESISDSVKIEDLEEATAQMRSNWEKRQMEKKRGFQEVQDARRVSQPAPPTLPAPQATEEPKYIDDDDDEELWSDDDDQSDTEVKRQKL